MAGRPRTTAKRLAELEETAFETYRRLEALRPAQYSAREGMEGDNEQAWWWNEAVRAVGQASIALSILLSRIEERAGLDWEALERQRAERRGLRVEEGEDAGIGNVNQAAT